MLPVMSPVSPLSSLPPETAVGGEAADAAETGEFGSLLGLLAVPPGVLSAAALGLEPEAAGGSGERPAGGTPVPVGGKPLPSWLLSQRGEFAADLRPGSADARILLPGQGLVTLATTFPEGLQGSAPAGPRGFELATSFEFSSALSAAQPGRPPAGPALLGGGAAPPLPLQSPDFDQALGQRLIGFAQQGLADARLRVHPEHLGPIEVRLRMEGESLQLSMASPHASVREALESALPRLREVLADAGLSLAQADVRSGTEQHRGDRGDVPDAPGSTEAQAGESGEADPASGAATLTPRRLTLVDTFA